MIMPNFNAGRHLYLWPKPESAIKVVELTVSCFKTLQSKSRIYLTTEAPREILETTWRLSGAY
jgi:hypothetical protein